MSTYEVTVRRSAFAAPRSPRSARPPLSSRSPSPSPLGASCTSSHGRSVAASPSHPPSRRIGGQKKETVSTSIKHQTKTAKQPCLSTYEQTGSAVARPARRHIHCRAQDQTPLCGRRSADAALRLPLPRRLSAVPAPRLPRSPPRGCRGPRRLIVASMSVAARATLVAASFAQRRARRRCCKERCTPRGDPCRAACCIDDGRGAPSRRAPRSFPRPSPSAAPVVDAGRSGARPEGIRAGQPVLHRRRARRSVAARATLVAASFAHRRLRRRARHARRRVLPPVPRQVHRRVPRHAATSTVASIPACAAASPRPSSRPCIASFLFL